MEELTMTLLHEQNDKQQKETIEFLTLYKNENALPDQWLSDRLDEVAKRESTLQRLRN